MLTLELQWVVLGEAARSFDLIPFHLGGLDFLFAISFVLGLYAVHRLAAIREEGDVTEKLREFRELRRVKLYCRLSTVYSLFTSHPLHNRHRVSAQCWHIVQSGQGCFLSDLSGVLALLSDFGGLFRRGAAVMVRGCPNRRRPATGYLWA
jgi:hypothetical protein